MLKCFSLSSATVAQPVEQLIRNQQVVCSSHISSSKTKGNCKSSCLSFWVPPPSGRLHPSVISMLGVGKAAPSPRQVPPFGRLRSETPLRRQCAIPRRLWRLRIYGEKRRRPEGRLGSSLVAVLSIQNIDFKRSFQINAARISKRVRNTGGVFPGRVGLEKSRLPGFYGLKGLVNGCEYHTGILLFKVVI